VTVALNGATHIVIPDTQVKPGVPTDHLSWIGQYIVDHFAGKSDVRIIHLGDHWDMPSLSSYDRGKKSMEGRRVLADLKAGNDGLDRLDAPLREHNAGKRATRHAQWNPEKHLLLGNHEDRISRAVEDDAQLDGLLSLDVVKDKAVSNGWQVHDYLDPMFLDGVGYAHFWANPMTGKPIGGMVSTRLKTIGHSFTMGHQQTFDYAVRFLRDGDGRVVSQHGLVAGACYLHDEDYKGYQGNAHWRGIIVCHEVRRGSYSLMQVTLDYLCRRYEGVSLDEFMLANGHMQAVA
jgi:hypothetical protein